MTTKVLYTMVAKESPSVILLMDPSETDGFRDWDNGVGTRRDDEKNLVHLKRSSGHWAYISSGGPYGLTIV